MILAGYLEIADGDIFPKDSHPITVKGDPPLSRRPLV